MDMQGEEWMGSVAAADFCKNSHSEVECVLCIVSIVLVYLQCTPRTNHKTAGPMAQW